LSYLQLWAYQFSYVADCRVVFYIGREDNPSVAKSVSVLNGNRWYQTYFLSFDLAAGDNYSRFKR
jgi:hypothetical protein